MTDKQTVSTMVTNLSNPDYESFYTLAPREAVIAAYALHTIHDANTWDYEDKYGHLVVKGERTIACGDWCAMLN